MTALGSLSAVLMAAVAAALLVPVGARPARALGVATGAARRPGWLPPAVCGVVVAVALLLGLPARAVALTAVLATAAWAGWGLVLRRRRRTAAVRTAERVRETCDLLATDLAAGRPAGHALDRACEDWSPLAPVGAAYAVGADVPAALRVLARRPGCGDLRLVAAGWEVAHRTGHGLADGLARVAAGLRARQATRRVVVSELASARSTARLLAGLPLLALLMGTGTGGNPWAFLLTTAVGIACLAAGLGLALAGLWWIEAIADDVEAGG